MNEELMNDAVFNCIIEGRQLSFVDTLQSACLRFGNEVKHLTDKLSERTKAIAGSMGLRSNLLGG